MMDGEEHAWRTFLREYGRIVLIVIRRFCLEPEDGEEVFQNTCLSVHRALDRLEDPAKLSAWVYSIASHHALRLLRNRRRDRNLEQAAWPEAPDPAAGAAEEVAAAFARARLIRVGLSGLDPRCQRLLSWLYLSTPPLTYAQISRDEGVPIGSIGPTRARCLEKLRRALQERGVSYPE